MLESHPKERFASETPLLLFHYCCCPQHWEGQDLWTASNPDPAACTLDSLGEPQFPHQENECKGNIHLAELL